MRCTQIFFCCLILVSLGCGGGEIGQNAQPQTPPNFLTLQPINGSIAVGKTIQFEATAHYNGGTTQNVTYSVSWSSTNSAVGSITTGGLVSGLAPGITDISASSSGYDCCTATTSLAVTNP